MLRVLRQCSRFAKQMQKINEILYYIFGIAVPIFLYRLLFHLFSLSDLVDPTKRCIYPNTLELK
jgi:hypothetical protein